MTDDQRAAILHQLERHYDELEVIVFSLDGLIGSHVPVIVDRLREEIARAKRIAQTLRDDGEPR